MEINESHLHWVSTGDLMETLGVFCPHIFPTKVSCVYFASKILYSWKDIEFLG